jgi:hypothetical protein
MAAKTAHPVPLTASVVQF